MAKQSVSKNYTVNAKGILNIDDMTIEVDEVGLFSIETLLRDFDGCEIALSAKYNEEQASPEVDVEADDNID